MGKEWHCDDLCLQKCKDCKAASGGCWRSETLEAGLLGRLPPSFISPRQYPLLPTRKLFYLGDELASSFLFFAAAIIYDIFQHRASSTALAHIDIGAR